MLHEDRGPCAYPGPLEAHDRLRVVTEHVTAERHVQARVEVRVHLRRHDDRDAPDARRAQKLRNLPGESVSLVPPGLVPHREAIVHRDAVDHDESDLGIPVGQLDGLLDQLLLFLEAVRFGEEDVLRDDIEIVTANLLKAIERHALRVDVDHLVSRPHDVPCELQAEIRLAAPQAFDLRLKPLRIDASRGPHVFRLETPRFAGRQVAKDDERSDRRDLGEDALVSHDVSDVERTEADEGRHPVHLAALLLAEQLRGRGNAPSERLRDLAGERLAEGVRAQIEVEASMDVLDARDESPRISAAVHAREDKGPYPADFLRREFAAVPAHLEDPYEIPAPLLLTRIAQGRFDSHAHPEVLDRLEGLESPERLDGQREVVRVLFTGDMREGHAFPRRELPDVLTQEPCEREPAADLGPARREPERAAGGASIQVEDVRRRYDRMLLQEVPGAEALVGRPFRSALDAKHLRRFRTARRYLRTGVAASGPIPEGEGISIPRRVVHRPWRKRRRSPARGGGCARFAIATPSHSPSCPPRFFSRENSRTRTSRACTRNTSCRRAP